MSIVPSCGDTLGGKISEDRAKWLTKETGLTEHAARVKVKQQFPSAFGVNDWSGYSPQEVTIDRAI